MSKVVMGIGALFAAVSMSIPLQATESIYTIGNSLTWDTKPYDLEGDVDFHIFCSRNLKYIQENPESHCVTESTPWTTALADNAYDWLVVQPFAGTTLGEDVSVISNWMAMQPDANLVIHPGWSPFVDFPTDYEAGNPDDMMKPSPKYISDLISELKLIDPDREIRSTRTNDILYSIWKDTQSGVGPLGSLAGLSRDPIHMGHDTGRYLSHNALRVALGQPLSRFGFGPPDENGFGPPNDSGFEIDSELEAYFNSKLLPIPEPGVVLSIVLSLSIVTLGHFRKR